LERVAEPGLPQALVCQLDLGHLCGGARYGGDLDDEHADEFAVAPSLMSTVASLPFFLFTLPAGAPADIVDRKRLMYVMNIWLAAAAGGLAILGWLHLLTPYVLLAGVFLIGVGFAFNAPAWTAIQPEIVSNYELPSAATLGGLQLNISGIIGPAIGGLLLPWIGANSVFALNGRFFFLLIFAIAQLKRKKAPSNLPLENFLESFITAIRYVRYAPGIQVVLARNILFAFFISVIPALPDQSFHPTVSRFSRMCSSR
jgi:MFS family permease